mmetsp:Transcript_706/g.1777  ORF Transcript_706/g.1777 Transcript_706/m.1777 type:complete len:124 (-) Transcript_706:101-472(-)|eukprot:CAMPEP_0202349690 /NCGR_PEP_ID=MMETSP1126-20121109/7077_1 /ASSEMBLY_ACC=CAM_ASM_000457 /TAXON_ID=3047 /ORGANISM="Dunaliella tertiolecta, Strain CCMP1320" /LENGTH=123 /DNA_ID=CAMNT_0048941543 /DNA_START=1 /DNA_END=372 /DNA_ORIENTATION=+
MLPSLASLVVARTVGAPSLPSLSSSLWRPLTATQVPQQQQQQQQGRGMAVWVDLDNNNLEKGLKQLNRKVRESGLQEELQDRQHHKIKSQRRFEREKAAYNRSMGKIIRERLTWLQRRKRVRF